MPLAKLASRVKPQPVHLIDVVANDVPKFVVNFPRRAEKLVPSKNAPSWDFFNGSISNLFDRLAKSVASSNFADKLDTLFGLRRRFYKHHSLWKPHASQLPTDFLAYGSLTRGALLWKLQEFRSKQKLTKGNLAVTDLAAVKWLRNHGTLIDCPSDGNLGPVILKKSAYDDMAFNLIDKSFVGSDVS